MNEFLTSLVRFATKFSTTLSGHWHRIGTWQTNSSNLSSHVLHIVDFRNLFTSLTIFDQSRYKLHHNYWIFSTFYPFPPLCNIDKTLWTLQNWKGVLKRVVVKIRISRLCCTNIIVFFYEETMICFTFVLPYRGVFFD